MQGPCDVDVGSMLGRCRVEGARCICGWKNVQNNEEVEEGNKKTLRRENNKKNVVEGIKKLRENIKIVEEGIQEQK